MNMTTNHGDRGTDTAFLRLMKVSGKAILKLLKVKNPGNYDAKAIVLKDKRLFPDIMAFPIMGSEDEIVFIEFQGYADKMIKYRTASRVTLACAQDHYTGSVRTVIVYTEKRFKEKAVDLDIKSKDRTLKIKGNFFEIALDEYTEQQLLNIDPKLIILAPFTASKRIRKQKRMMLAHQWGIKVRQAYPANLHVEAIDVLSLFILSRFRNLSLEEVKDMLNFDLSNTVAGKQLIGIGHERGEKKGIKKGEKKGIKKGGLNTAKKMLKDGFKFNQIKKYTGLTYKELNTITK